MTPEQWQRLQLLFDSAMKLPASEQRAFALSACADDAAMLEELLSLLAAGAQGHETQASPSMWLDLLSGPGPIRFETGSIVSGRYRIDRLLGRGGMGDVYEAWDQELSIRVALKTLHHASDTDEGRRRLQLEGMLARAVWHPNVCRMYDLGLHQDGEEAIWFLTMELLPGRTLAEALAEERPFELARVQRLAEQMAAGLGAAHRSGVIHRDFKPANILLVEREDGEHAVVTDFGIAHAREDASTSAEPAHLFGTPAYMAPEQLRGESVGPAADIYALGLVLFEIVTGALPFAGAPASEASARRLTEDPPSPRELRPELDPRCEEAILRCLDRDASRRFARAEDLIDALAGRLPTERPEARDDARATDRGLTRERDAFVGRETDLAELERAQAAGARLVTLVGAAGMGKTRLAVHYAWRSLDRWPGGIWFCDLKEARDRNAIVQTVARALGVELGRGNAVAQLAHAIAGHGRCLLVLDNAERVGAIAAEVVRSWLARASEAHFLVTSREQLTVGEDELVQRIDSLSLEAAVDLFQTRAQWLRPDFVRGGNEAGAVEELVRLVDYMPLAIELAAARIRVMSVTQIVEQMRKRFSLLTGGATARHETLLGTINDSWDLLDRYERAAFSQCAVFEGGFTMEAAEAILAFEGANDGVRVIGLLQSLIDKSLLQSAVATSRSGAVAPRFRMLATLHEYARMRLAEVQAGSGAECEDAVRDRHSAWFTRHCRTLGRALRDGGGTGEPWHALEVEHANLVRACRRAIERGDGAVATSAYLTLRILLTRTGPFSLAVELGAEILRSVPLSPEDEVQVLLTLANSERFAGQTAEATRHVELALARAQTSGNRAVELEARDTFIRLLTIHGKMKEAREHAETALALSRELGNRLMEGFVLSAIGELNRVDGQVEEAQRNWTDAVAIAREIGDRRMEGIVLNNLGMVNFETGHMVEARRAFQAALELHRASGNRKSEGIVLANLGKIHQSGGELDAALGRFSEALAVQRELGHRRFEGAMLSDLGGIHRERGELDAANDHLERALAIHRESGDRAFEGMTLTELGMLRCEEGRAGEALLVYHAALDLHREAGDRRLEGITQCRLAELELEQGKWIEAESAIVQSDALLRPVGDLAELARLLCAHAALLLERGDLQAANRVLFEAQEVARRAELAPRSEGGRRLAAIRERLERSAIG